MSQHFNGRMLCPKCSWEGLPVFYEEHFCMPGLQQAVLACGKAAAGKIEVDYHVPGCECPQDITFTQEQLKGSIAMSAEEISQCTPLGKLEEAAKETYLDREEKAVPNPKSLDSNHKVQTHFCPPAAIIAIATVIAQGHKKPGRTPYNWRKHPVTDSSYTSAADRHLLKHRDGEDFDEELSKLAGRPITHIEAALSSLAIYVDAKACGTLIDDRFEPGVASSLLDDIAKTTLEQKK